MPQRATIDQAFTPAMQTLSHIKALLESRGLAPRKALGQNFLIDKNLVSKLLSAAGVHAGDLVLEVGPGTGTLTEGLLELGCEVVACELDRGLSALLREWPAAAQAGGPGSLRVIEGDCLEGRGLNKEVVAAIGGRRFGLVANLPYNAATPLMMVLLIDHPSCDRLAVTIQKEVVDRLSAGPGTKQYGTLGIVAQALAGVEVVAKLPPECFWPRPDVTSSMVVLRRLSGALTADAPGLSVFCQELFSKRRKQIGAILGRDRDWPAGVRPEQRPEELTIAQIEHLRLWRGGRRVDGAGA
ncbi:MAG: 16S rRNA (adenine(1518)-N(6)/adenine(1519)-N(6))-dimethyltransferase RsmA [Phycisphaerales bacterium]